MEKRYLNADETCEYLGIKKPTLYEMTSQRRIPFVKLGTKMLRFDVRALEQWIEAKRVAVMDIGIGT